MKRMIIAILMLGMIILIFMPRPWLLITEVNGRLNLQSIPMGWFDHFKICYTHSVDGQRVCEVFRLTWSKGIVLQETYFQMFGAGMGHWEGHGTVVEEESIKIKNINKPLGKFYLRIGSRGVDHTLSLRGKDINLSRQAEGKLVEVKIETKPYVYQLGK